MIDSMVFTRHMKVVTIVILFVVTATLTVFYQSSVISHLATGRKPFATSTSTDSTNPSTTDSVTAAKTADSYQDAILGFFARVRENKFQKADTTNDLPPLERVVLQEYVKCTNGVQHGECNVSPCELLKKDLNAQQCTLGCVNDQCNGCRARCRCHSDDDCTSGQFCRVASDEPEEKLYVCADARSEFEYCAGFVPPSVENRCDRGLDCVEEADSEVADLPGVCLHRCGKVSPVANVRRQCKDNVNHFCSNGGYCLRNDGGQFGCIAAQDCTHPNSKWVHPMCTGHAECHGFFCSWVCDQDGL
jgi:hypothetical protein